MVTFHSFSNKPEPHCIVRKIKNWLCEVQWLNDNCGGISTYLTEKQNRHESPNQDNDYCYYYYYIYSLMSFFIGNQEKFQTNSSVHNINVRNKHHLHRPVANLSCFQKGASYSGIRIFNSLPRSITNLKNEKTQFKVALKRFLNARSFYSVDELFTCTDDMYRWLYDCVNVSYTVIFLLFVCLWNVPHPIVLWLSRIYGMYVCMYVCMQIQSYCK